MNDDERLSPTDHTNNVTDPVTSASLDGDQAPAMAASGVETSATKRKVAELRNHAQRYIHAAQRALTVQFRRKFATQAFRLAQRAEAMERGDIRPDLAYNPATEQRLMTALHLRDRAAYCRGRAAIVGRPDVSGVLYLTAQDYEHDAQRLEATADQNIAQAQ